MLNLTAIYLYRFKLTFNHQDKKRNTYYLIDICLYLHL